MTCMVEIMKIQGLQSHSLIKKMDVYGSSPSRTGSPADNPSPRRNIQVTAGVDHPPPSRYSSTFYLDFSDSMLPESVPKSTTNELLIGLKILTVGLPISPIKNSEGEPKKSYRTFHAMHGSGPGRTGYSYRQFCTPVMYCRCGPSITEPVSFHL
jgi:hypothetical protein